MYKEIPIEVSYVAYKRILDSMCRIILKHVLDGSDGFKMPFGLGYIQDGYKFRLHWSRIPQTFPDRYKYQLCLVRANKRRLAKLIFNKTDYININDIQVYKM